MGSNQEIRVGIVGFGGIAGAHAEAIRSIPNARLVAAADVVQARLDLAKEKYGVDCYLDYHDLLARDDITVVDVCTPSGLHGTVAIDAARAKKHVITEKPIDVTLARADEMIRAAKENHVRFSVIFQCRFSEGASKIKALLEEGRLGDIFLADAYVKWYRTQEYYEHGLKWRGTIALDGGGAIINQSVHYIDLLQWFVGPVASVCAQKATVAHKIEGEDVCVGILRFKNGAMGVIEGSTACYPGFDARVELHGTKGSVTWAGGQVRSLNIVGEETQEEAQPAEKGGGGAADPMTIQLSLHALQLQSFFQEVAEDRPPSVSGEEARKALEIITALYRSADTGKTVSLPL